MSKCDDFVLIRTAVSRATTLMPYIFDFDEIQIFITHLVLYGVSGLFRPADFMFQRVPQRPRAVVFVKHLPNLLLHAKTDTLKHLITTYNEETPVR